jgi:anaerobic ribonucleoside-triphosphate reductase activating protein
MRIAGIDYNDTAAAPGISLTVYVSGCEHRCPGCHNPEAWDFNYGEELNTEIMYKILNGLTANNISRTLCIMGGEPLHPRNREAVGDIITNVKERFPNIEIWLWTGYLYEDLLMEHNPALNYIFSKVDVLVDGPYIQEQRDITLKARGSRNQRIIYLQPQ